MRDSQVAKTADGSVILQTSAISSEEEGLPQLPSMFGISNETTHVQLRQNKLQTLQTFMHQQ